MRRNKMKVIAVVAMLFAVMISANAQVQVGMQAGLNFSTLSGMADYMGKSRNDYKKIYYGPAVHAGVILQYTNPDRVFLQPELLFSMQSNIEKVTDGLVYTSLAFLKLPIYIGHKINIDWGRDIVLGIGPYLAYGLFAYDNSYLRSIPVFSFGEDGLFNRFDAGLSAMVGLEYEDIQVSIGYDWGLADMNKVRGPVIQTRNLKLSAVRFF